MAPPELIQLIQTLSVVCSVEDLVEAAARRGSKRDRRKVLVFVVCLLGWEAKLFGFVCQAGRGSSTGRGPQKEEDIIMYANLSVRRLVGIMCRLLLWQDIRRRIGKRIGKWRRYESATEPPIAPKTPQTNNHTCLWGDDPQKLISIALHDSAAIWIRIRIVRCERPAKRQPNAYSESV